MGLRTAPSSTVERLRSRAFWDALLSESEEHEIAVPRMAGHHGRADRAGRIAAFRNIVSSGEALAMVDAFERQDYEPSLPVQIFIDKAGGKKKTIYMFPPSDNLLFRAVNRHLQDRVAGDISPVCHSFQRGKGVQTVLDSLLRDSDIDTKHCLRLDVTEYFNSIRVLDLLEGLPASITTDGPLLHLLVRVLCRPEVIRAGRIVYVEQKGVMAGTPLSCLLSNLYLKELDELFRRSGVTYARYSDDIIVFASQPELSDCEAIIRDFLHMKGLHINEHKTKLVLPGESWEYLGLRYHRGTIDLSENTVRKARAKIRRLSRLPFGFAGSRLDATVEFIQQLNRKFYGWGAESTDFNWATWFFPVLTTAATLKSLDLFAQDKIRQLATGSGLLRNHKSMPYATLREMGYVPLTAAYFAMRRGTQHYRRVLTTRLACRPQSGVMRTTRWDDQIGSPPAGTSAERSEETLHIASARP